MPEKNIRADMVLSCQALERSGLNRGASGNLSVRSGTDMLITPSAVAYPVITAEMMARMSLVSDDDEFEGPKKPSSEWRFHRDILKARPDVNAVVHTHAPFCTILSIARKPIPAVHYMMAAFGGPDVRVAEYARYGTAALSGHVIRAMEGRNGCLMANHGMLVAAADLTQAVWLAEELEALAHQYYHTLAIGGGHVLNDGQIAETLEGFASYGVQAKRPSDD